MIDKCFSIYRKNREVFNYFIVGCMTTLVGLVSYYICVSTFLNPKNAIELQIANVISWILAVLFAYFTNRKFVFESTNKKLAEFIKFILSRLSTLLVDMFCMFLFVTVCSIDDKISKLIVQVIVFVLNYIFSKFLVFRKKQN